MYTARNKKRNKSKLPLILLVSGALLLAAGVGAWYFWYRDAANSSTITDSGFKEEDEPTTPPPRDGGVVDTSEDDTSSEPTPDTSITSESGKITVYQPQKDALLQNDGTLSGASSYTMVNYRIIDDAIGVIGTGSLNVRNGKFSGKFSINSTGKEGRLDVFYADSSGRESDVIEIPVRFK